MHRHAARWLLAFLAAATLVGILPGTEVAEAQYFGRNKVQYETFNFEVLATEHFDIYYYRQEREAAVEAARMSERWYARISRLMDADLTGRQPLILYANHPHFEQTTAIPGEIGESTGGVTEPLKRRVVLPMAGPLAETDHVVGHELVHAFQFSLTGVDPSTPLFRIPGALTLPLWMIEGMAEYLSVGPHSSHTTMWLRDAMQRDDGLPTVQQLGNPRKWFPYRYGHALWSYIAGQYGPTSVKEIYRAAGTGGSVGRALTSVLKTPVDSLNARWHEAIRSTYEPLEEKTEAAVAYGDTLVAKERGGGSTNIGPALSPDGERVVFISERSLFAFEMYLADARTGEVIRKITRTAVDPHYQSLQFINSAGAWSPESDRFAFAAVSKGKPVLSVVDPQTGEKVREIRLPRFGEVFNPSWSPDGTEIAFVANEGGFLDLFVVSVASGDVRQLTDDPYAELHPDWSPDGDRIAFVTDRFGADMENLKMGSYRLALIHPESGRITALPAFEGAKHVNPQWSPDGRSLYYVSDRKGVSNLYRMEVASGRTRQVTNVFTGVTGITALSPSVSVASGSGAAVISAYEKGNYNLYRIDSEDVLAGTELADPVPGLHAGNIPTGREAGASRVTELLERPELGLPSALTFDDRDYEPKLSLDFISQPSLAFGVSSFGTFISGGASLHFSDMLGHHNLTTLLQVQSQGGPVLNGVGALGAYQNRKRRLNWGGVAGQVPEMSFGFRLGFQDVDGDGRRDFLQETIRFWKINRVALAAASYPVSSVQRVELTGGFERIDFELQREILAFSQVGRKLVDETFDAPACGDSLVFRRDFCEPAAMNEATTGVALVYDNSIGGPTGPILGQRYRLEASPSVGTLNFLSATADYRRYVMPFRPVTLAGRLLHFGRWGGGANDQRLRQLYAGSPWLIRGYDLNSFNIRRCPPDVDLELCSELEAFRNLIGTRLGVANAEVRVPLLGPLGLLSRSGYAPPIELVGFFDAGMAWEANDPDTPGNEQAFFFGGDREPLTSAGVGLRINLLGFAVGELDYVKPFDRPDRGAYFTFNLVPGF